MADRPLNGAERALLERLCAGDWDGADAARQQLALARYAGPGHAGNDNCFDLAVPDDVPLIELPDGAAHVLSVYEGGESTGYVELDIKAGRLWRLDHTWWTDSPGPLPRADQLR